MEGYCPVEWDADGEYHSCMYEQEHRDEHVCTCGARLILEVESE